MKKKNKNQGCEKSLDNNNECPKFENTFKFPLAGFPLYKDKKNFIIADNPFSDEKLDESISKFWQKVHSEVKLDVVMSLTVEGQRFFQEIAKDKPYETYTLFLDGYVTDALREVAELLRSDPRTKMVILRQRIVPKLEVELTTIGKFTYHPFITLDFGM